MNIPPDFWNIRPPGTLFAARTYSGKLADYLRQLRACLDEEVEFRELEANAWRSFGLLVEDVHDERIITQPENPK
jgi:hypothetical protein